MPNNPKCGARTRQEESSGSCQLAAGWGTEHPGYGLCRLHGGNTKTQKTAASRLKADHDVRTILAQLDVRPVDDPLTALLQLGGQVLAWQEATSTLVQGLQAEIRYEGKTGTEQLRAEIVLYERAMDRAAQVLGLIAKLNIEERLAGIQERQADRVIAAIDAALAAAGVTGQPAAEARLTAARHLQAVPNSS